MFIHQFSSSHIDWEMACSSVSAFSPPVSGRYRLFFWRLHRHRRRQNSILQPYHTMNPERAMTTPYFQNSPSGVKKDRQSTWRHFHASSSAESSSASGSESWMETYRAQNLPK